MRILFVLYGDLSTNTFGPLSLFARQLHKLDHECILAIPDVSDDKNISDDSGFKVIRYEDIFRLNNRIFNEGAAADIIHACTPRIGVFYFIKEYMHRWPTPLVIYLEDNEKWISQQYLAVDDEGLLAIDDTDLYLKLPSALSHPFDYLYFIALADSVILIQDKLCSEIPSFIPMKVIPWGVDHSIFHPAITSSSVWRSNLKIDDHDKVIVYHGGLNGFIRSAMIDLCLAVELINANGISCKLIRTGSNAINFWDELSPHARNIIFEVGVVPKEDLPAILALADIYVQPGRVNPFEDLRLPSKLLEFLSMGKPVIVPNVNIAELLSHSENAWILEKGDPEEIATAAIYLFKNSDKAIQLGRGAREFAKIHFDIPTQTSKLIAAYRDAITNFDAPQTKQIWDVVKVSGLLSAVILRIKLIIASQKDSDQGLLVYMVKLLELQGQRLTRLGMRLQLLETEKISLLNKTPKNKQILFVRLANLLRFWNGK